MMMIHRIDKSNEFKKGLREERYLNLVVNDENNRKGQKKDL